MRILSLSILFSLVLLSCSNLLQSAGGTTDTGNSHVIANICTPDGSPVPGARVILRSSDFLSGGQVMLAKASCSQKETFTDECGRFEFYSIDTGSYCIEVNDCNAAACLLTCRIGLGDTLITLGTDTVHPYATVKGIAAVSPGSLGTVFVQIFGLERRVPLDAAGHFTIADLPDGLFRFRVAAKNGIFDPILIDSVQAVSGAITEIPYAGWRFRKIIALNTTSSGAGVAGAAYNFPVVIRLSGNNFDFSLAAGNGADIRFAKSNGASLPFEIELWDSSGEAGIVWVKVDTVLGNNADQYIVMHHGFPAAANGSNGAAVFDTAHGFQGVWHLDEAGNTTAKDATANGYDGAHFNTTPASALDGAIGGARAFNGASSYITMNGTAGSRLSFPQNGSYALSAWVCVDTLDSKWHAIAGKGHEQYYLKLKCFGNNRATWEFVEFQDQEGWEYTEDSIPPAPGPRQWVFLTGVRSGSRQSLYVNGLLVNNSTPLMVGDYARNTGDDFTIGRHARQVTIPYNEGWCYFSGKVDEVRVMNAVPGPDWIKLCYMNQKAEDALVEFR